MLQNKLRIGRFTSSEIGSLMKNDRTGKGFGKPALTYIEEVGMERRLGRSLSRESNARPLTWGKLCEDYVFGLLGLDYTIVHTDTIVHPQYDFWSGTPDATKEEKTVVEVKAPITLKSFCQFVDCNSIEEVRENHTDGEKYYWQVVSNSVLTGATHAELIIYAPYKWELDEIRNSIPKREDSEKYKWINWAEDIELPYLIEGNHYKNLNVISWEVSKEDQEKLTARVLQAESHLNNLK